MTMQSVVDGPASPYSRVAARLVDQGYSVLPVAPGTKVPSERRRGEWRAMYDWTRFCSRRPTDVELRIWSTWPDAGVCVCMGPASGNLVAIDIDVEDFDIWQAVEAVVGESVVEKRGRRGYTSFWRGPSSIVSTKFSIGKKTIVDLLAAGKQSVLPPSQHPNTNRPYEWIRGSLENMSPDRLPMLPDDISDLIGEALKPFGYRPPVAPRNASDGSSACGGYYAEINSAALARIAEWTPKLGVKLYPGSDGGVRIQRPGGGDRDNISIHPRGVKDWAHGEIRSPIDAVMAARGLSLDSSAQWLRDFVGPKIERFNFKASVRG